MSVCLRHVADLYWSIGAFKTFIVYKNIMNISKLYVNEMLYKGETLEAENYLSKFTSPTQSLVRMRGLPYTVTAEEIVSSCLTEFCLV